MSIKYLRKEKIKVKSRYSSQFTVLLAHNIMAVIIM